MLNLHDIYEFPVTVLDILHTCFGYVLQDHQKYFHTKQSKLTSNTQVAMCWSGGIKTGMGGVDLLSSEMP